MDLDQLRQILTLVQEHELSEFEFEQDGLRLFVLAGDVDDDAFVDVNRRSANCLLFHRIGLEANYGL